MHATNCTVAGGRIESAQTGSLPAERKPRENRLEAMKNKVNDEDLTAHILLNMPNEYSELITAVEGDLDRISVATL